MAEREKLTPEELKRKLFQFHGTGVWYQMYPKFVITEGVKFLCEQAGCFWLLDIIWSVRVIPDVEQHWWQRCELVVDLEECTGVFMIEDRVGEQIYRQEIPFTDFPLDSIVLYSVRQPTDERIVCLPSED